MPNLRADRAFFEWLRQISTAYGDGMSAWGQAVHDAAGAGVSPALLTATDSAIDRLVQMLMSVGRQHEERGLPDGALRVLEALDELLGASVELLRVARTGLEAEGIAALASLSPRIGGLRQLEERVERAAGQMRDNLGDALGDAADGRAP